MPKYADPRSAMPPGVFGEDKYCWFAFISEKEEKLITHFKFIRILLSDRLI